MRREGGEEEGREGREGRRGNGRRQKGHNILIILSVLVYSQEYPEHPVPLTLSVGAQRLPLHGRG